MTIPELLIDWYRQHKRPLPWRNTRDAYTIWISEIILQQTRVSQGLPYYQEFIRTFPDVDSLAMADESDVLHLWQGLGYYSRARNMHEAAKDVISRYHGIFPKDFESLRTLKGVGEYTAAAVASIAGGQAVPVVDGNVLRFFSRLFGIQENINLGPVKKKIRNLVGSWLEGQDPGEVNQAIMEFGALQCVPGLPDCSSCPLKDHCTAFQNNMVKDIPYKTAKSAPRDRYLIALVMQDSLENPGFFLSKRKESDIWKGLYTFPFLEYNALPKPGDLAKYPDFLALMQGAAYRILPGTSDMMHILTHQRLHIRFFRLIISSHAKEICQRNEWLSISLSALLAYPMPRMMHKYLDEGLSTLNNDVRL